MKKRLLAVLLGGVLVLSACGQKTEAPRGDYEEEEEEPVTEKPEPTEAEAEPEEEEDPVDVIPEEEEDYGFTPIPELDGMEVCGLLYCWRPYGDTGIYNCAPAVVDEQYYVVRDGDCFGLIDIDGNWIAEPVYAQVSYGYDYYICTGYEYDDEAYGVDHGELFALGEDAYAQANGTSPDGGVYWDAENGKMIYSDQSNMDGIDYDYPGTLACTLWEERTERDCKYAVVAAGELVTDFVYDNATVISEGLIAVERDGAWGYVNTDGYEFIPCEYEAIRAEDYGYDKQIEYMADNYPDSYSRDMAAEYIQNWEDHFFAPACTDGYIVLCLEGEYALYDRDYEEVVPFGIFESISEVTNGRFFAKKNGEWGLCEIPLAW